MDRPPRPSSGADCHIQYEGIWDWSAIQAGHVPEVSNTMAACSMAPCPCLPGKRASPREIQGRSAPSVRYQCESCPTLQGYEYPAAPGEVSNRQVSLPIATSRLHSFPAWESISRLISSSFYWPRDPGFVPGSTTALASRAAPGDQIAGEPAAGPGKFREQTCPTYPGRARSP